MGVLVWQLLASGDKLLVGYDSSIIKLLELLLPYRWLRDHDVYTIECRFVTSIFDTTTQGHQVCSPPNPCKPNNN